MGGQSGERDRRQSIGKRPRRVWRLTLTSRRLAVLERIMAKEKCNRAEAFDILCHVHEWGFTSRVKMDVRGRIQAIATAADLAVKHCNGGSPTALHLREIRRAAMEIPILMGDGPDGTRVGQLIILPQR